MGRHIKEGRFVSLFHIYLRKSYRHPQSRIVFLGAAANLKARVTSLY